MVIMLVVIIGNNNSNDVVDVSGNVVYPLGVGCTPARVQARVGQEAGSE